MPGSMQSHRRIIWDKIKDKMQGEFIEGRFAEGLALGIREAGLQLQEHFPFQDDDVNELPDDISFGDETIEE